MFSFAEVFKTNYVPAKHTHTCPHCEGSSSYNYDFDSFYCDPCDLWLESACTDSAVMPYFGGRPATPKGVLG